MRGAPRIEDSYTKQVKYPTVVERYYSKYYYQPEELPEGETHCILMHSNRICLLTLAEKHPVIANKKTIARIDFQVTDKLNRTQNKVVGKGKKGAQVMGLHSVLCCVHCEDGSTYTVYGCVRGKLIEINQKVVENNQLLVDRPLAEGFIAIIMPHLKDIEQQKGKFILAQVSVADENPSQLLEIDSCC